MKRSKPLAVFCDRLILAIFIGILAIVVGNFLIFGNPVDHMRCLLNQSIEVGTENIELKNKVADYIATDYLKRLQEQPLWSPEIQVEESYRIIFSHSLGSTQSVKIWKTGNDYFLLLKKEYLIKTQSGKLERTFDRKLDIVQQLSMKPEAWQEFKRLAMESCYWGMTPKIFEAGGKDGHTFILEGRKDNRYHAVSRWVPDSKSDYHELCSYLLKLAGIKVRH